MENIEIEKSKAHVTVEISEYMSHSVVSKTVISKLTGNIKIISFDNGEGVSEKISPFDTFVQIIDGVAAIEINSKSQLLEAGQSIIIPAHSSSSIKSKGRFKMISTVIKSGYEE